MYNNCGTFLPFQIGGIDGGSDVDMQPHQGTGPLGAGTYCSYQSRPTFPSGCYKYSDGLASGGDSTTRWGTFTYQVTLGSISGGFFVNSNVKAWVHWMGDTSPATKFIDYTTNLRANGTDKYGRLWLLTYQTSKDPTEITQNADMWYANVIISDQPIPKETADAASTATAGAGSRVRSRSRP